MARAEDGGITIRVLDQGPGMDADQISMIMQDIPPSKKKDTEGENKGYGIGLKVVREFVHLHGGRFWVEPSSPRGAQFCFTLPLRPTHRKERS